MFKWLRQKWKPSTKKASLTALAKPLDLSQLRKRAKIVVIDDDSNAFPVNILQNEGYTIEQWDEVKSLDRLERGDFDIIVLDIAGVAKKLTGSDGLGILKHLKQANPSQVVVAFSGQSFDIGKTEFFQLADDTLAKPVDALKCKQVLDHLIQSKLSVEHLWQSIVAALKKENVADSSIRSLETQICRAIAQGESAGFEATIKGIVERHDLVLRIAGVLVKIAGLCTTSAG